VARLERQARERRRRLMFFAAAGAAVAVVALVVVGSIARGGGSSTTPADVNREGRVLGVATAPVTLVAWEDFQCPFCKQANDNALAQVITDYVKPGLVKIEYATSPSRR
jgi:protein-disulfide isomerase